MQYTRTLTLNCIVKELVPLLFFILKFCPEDNSNCLRCKHDTLQVNSCHVGEAQVTNTITLGCNLRSHCPLSFFICKFRLEHISKTIRGINMKLYRWIDLIKVECSTQKHYLFIERLMSFCPLSIFILQLCSKNNPKINTGTNMILHRRIDLSREVLYKKT